MYEPLKRDSHQFEHSGQFGSITRQFGSFKVSNLDFETPAWTLKLMCTDPSRQNGEVKGKKPSRIAAVERNENMGQG
ncbi:hypothetical protein PoB_000232500 [Plakobranchus ocellatus]|uniref:Uncharacterized protein n=1 Tax=Plakobranchus ocellatus TaxID=259542 RepID=A0AAV3XZD0_9GAST|nr:hypothetical protein PoB_000232500 [Plakobranchus ocellatus]